MLRILSSRLEKNVRAAWLATGVLLLAIGAGVPHAQNSSPPPKSADASDIQLVEKLLVARRNYQQVLEQLRLHYLKTQDLERAKWAEEELKQYHRIPKHAFRLELDVPPPNLIGNTNVPEANRLLMAATSYKDKGWGTDYVDNQRRAEILLQKMLTEYPQSDKISDAAYHLGDIYESKAYKQYRRAVAYYERCYQWNPKTQLDARLRAARVYDRNLADRGKAIELYREVTTHDTDTRRVQEATKRLADLAGTR